MKILIIVVVVGIVATGRSENGTDVTLGDALFLAYEKR